MLQIILTLLGFIVLVIPAGWYLYKVSEQKPGRLDALFNPLDRALYALCGIDKKPMTLKSYTLALLLTNGLMLFAGYAVLRLQQVLPLNPSSVQGMAPDLSFNTIVSFMTNTNLQHYSGESGLSYLSQMLVITGMMFTSAATGCAACMAFLRAVSGMASLGNYYVDMVRLISRVFLPLSFILALLLVWQGVPQTMQGTLTVSTIEGKQQDIAVGPIASLVSIKHLGTNGGGFLGANSSSPQENPTIISNLLELYAMMLLPGACLVVFGAMLLSKRRERVKPRKAALPALKMPKLLAGEARAIFISMGLLFLFALAICYTAESSGNPALERIGLSQSMGSMEGKEVRFGVAQSALFSITTTSFTTGTVNNMHDTLTPLGGMAAMLQMMLNVVFGGVGVGLMNMMMYVLLAVFLCGLLVGRTPEYLGKKIEAREMKLVTLTLILHPLLILGFSALAVSTAQGLAGISNPGFHGLSQVLYEYASAAANNGSGFEGMADNTVFWNLSTGLVMFYARYLPIILQLAVAGALFAKKPLSVSAGTLHTGSFAFSATLTLLVLLFAALTFLPALALGPLAEHLTLWN